MKNLTDQEKIGYFRAIYRALSVLGKDHPEVCTAAIASLRLLLIDAVGEDHQKNLVAAWNDELSGPQTGA